MLNLFDHNKNPKYFAMPLLIIFVIASFGIGFAFGEGRVQFEQGKVEINRGTPPQNADYSLLWETLDTINKKHVEQPLDQQKLLYGAVKGLVSSLSDPYTTFYTPEEARKFTEELEGAFDGIGAEIGIKDEQLVVVAPLEDTPAEKAGLLPGDFILAIGGEPTAGLTVEQAVSKIRGKAGTEVMLMIKHKSKKEPVEIKIIRSRIEVKSLKFESKEVDGKKIGIVKLNRFGEDAAGLLTSAVDQMLSGNYNGMILDLRSNPGGFLETSIRVASNWVPDGEVVVREVNNEDKEKLYRSSGSNRLKGFKTIVLVNGGSASASEIVAGALQDHKLGTLVGEKTFGKGSVQELVHLKDESELKVTTAKWLTPKGRDINKQGLEPDIKIELTDADFEADKDPQMDKALELLK